MLKLFEYNLNQFKNLILHKADYWGDFETILIVYAMTHTHSQTGSTKKIVCDLTHTTQFFLTLQAVKMFQQQYAATALLFLRSPNWTVNRINSVHSQKVNNADQRFRVSDTPFRQLPTKSNGVKTQRCWWLQDKLKWVNAETLNRTGHSALPAHVSIWRGVDPSLIKSAQGRKEKLKLRWSRWPNHCWTWNLRSVLSTVSKLKVLDFVCSVTRFPTWDVWTTADNHVNRFRALIPTLAGWKIINGGAFGCVPS